MPDSLLSQLLNISLHKQDRHLVSWHEDLIELKDISFRERIWTRVSINLSSCTLYFYNEKQLSIKLEFHCILCNHSARPQLEEAAEQTEPDLD